MIVLSPSPSKAEPSGTGISQIQSRKPIDPGRRLNSSTPSNRLGSASQGPSLTNASVEDVRPMFQHDIEQRTSSVSFHDFMLFLLSQLMKDEDLAKEDHQDTLKTRLDQLTKLAFELCNTSKETRQTTGQHSKFGESTRGGQETFAGEENRKHGSRVVEAEEHEQAHRRKSLRKRGDRDKGASKDWNGALREHLMTYRDANAQEQSRYRPFVKLANTALAAWESVSIELKALGLPEPPRDGARLIFQCNDPKRIVSVHSGMDRHLLKKDDLRVPDLVGLTLRTALTTRPQRAGQEADSIGEHQWKEHSDTFAAEKPGHAPGFHDVLMSLEFKMDKKGAQLPGVPHSWAHKDLSECDLAEPQLAFPLDVQSSTPLPVGISNLRSETSPSITSSSGSGSSGRKRKAGSNDEDASESKKIRISAQDTYATLPQTEGVEGSEQRELKKSRKWPAAIQTASYAAERLSSSVAITHAFNAVIEDQHIWLWWYDRGGAVQSQGLDFVTDFPHLMVLFGILRSFDEESWGTCKEVFPPSVDGEHIDFKLGSCQFQMPSGWHPQALTLFGRGTDIINVTSESINPLDPERTLKDRELVMKVYWPKERRTSEEELLKLAYAIGSQNGTEHVRGHLPVLVASVTLHGKDSAVAKRRQLLKLPDTNQGALPNKQQQQDSNKPRPRYITRCLRLMVFYKLRPIWELSGEDFLMAWLDCYRCHWELWRESLHHRDISCNNLMYYKTDAKKIAGVLNDFDLSIFLLLDSEFATERTGTVPFMAFELINYRKGAPPAHIYNFEQQSFVYVLLWITCRYAQDGKGRIKTMFNTFNDWRQRNLQACALAHLNALEEEQQPTKAHEDYAFLVNSLRLHIHAEYLRRRALKVEEEAARRAAARVSASQKLVETRPNPYDLSLDTKRYEKFLNIIRTDAPPSYKNLIDQVPLQLSEGDTVLWDALARRGREGELWERLLSHRQDSGAITNQTPRSTNDQVQAELAAALNSEREHN